ncbi:tetratricopeptide repeat protein [Candidatus Dependentiae bacterium]
MNKLGCVLELIVGRPLYGEQVGGELVQQEQLQDLVKLGFSYYAEGKNKEAIGYFKQALKVCERADIYNDLGLVYLSDGDYGKAVNAFKKALDIDKGYLPAFYNLGITMYYARNYEVAANIFEDVSKAKGLDKDILANAHNDKGCAQNRKGDLASAEKSFEAALVIDDKLVGPYVNLGNMYCNQGRFDDAKVKYNKAIALNEKCAAAYNGLGVVAVEEGKFDEAEKYFDKALQISKHCTAAEINKMIINKAKNQEKDKEEDQDKK